MGRRRLVVFGDSWVEGQRKIPKLEITPYNMVYHLGQKLGCEVVNRGKFGSSNESIGNEVIRWISNNDTSNDVFLVVWSEMKRIVEQNRHVFRDTNTGAIYRYDDWQHLTGGSREHEDIRTKYFPHFRAPAYHRLMFENCMHCIRMLCHDYDIPFLMSNSIDTTPMHGTIYYQGKDRKINYQMGKSLDDFIEGYKPNNSLLDILTNRWIREDVQDLSMITKHSVLMNDYDRNPDKYPLLTKCVHPTDEGHEFIAATLAPYIQPILEK